MEEKAFSKGVKMIFKGVPDSLVKECETKTKLSNLEACITFSLCGMKKRPKFVVLPYEYVKEFLFYRQSDFFNELLSENIESIAIHKEYNDIINENYNQIALEQDIQVVNIMKDYGFEPYDEIKYHPKGDKREHTAIVFNRVNNENGDSVLYL